MFGKQSIFMIYVVSCSLLIDLGQCDPRQSTVVSQSKANDKFRVLGVFGHPGKSHFDVFRPLLEELARKGHDVTVISYFPRDDRTSSPLPNYHDISLRNQTSDVFLNVVDLTMIQHSPISVFLELILLRSWGLKACSDGLYNPGVRKLIKSDAKFDVMITEAFNSDCFLALAHRFNVPFISFSSHQLMPWVNGRFSNEDNPSYIPSIFNGFGPSMTFFERVINTLTLPVIKLAYKYGFIPAMQNIVHDVFGPDVPALSEIAKNSSLVLVNTHYSLHGSKPNLPSVIELGGIHISPNVKPLPDDLQRFLDEAKEGVLYFSLGSMIKASTMPKDKLQMIVNVFRDIPRKVIWKWEAEDMPNKPKNLLIRHWLPQVAILQHPNVKCFMAHGGLLGLSESVWAGVPMIAIPMYGDQFYNAAAAKARGVAEVLRWNDLTERDLRQAVDRVFNDSGYSLRARALAKAYNDRPESPLETAVWWTEYIARGNGIPYLRSAAQDLTWYQYYLLDVVFITMAVVTSSIFIVSRLVRYIFKSQNRHEKKTTKKE
ncbi:UDP-glycosyltransferase UGT5-like [Venturia canescens]|uniref:UDP-glycosyltransferase UGT5-like n=1 Tax=Venturia canescens TaxID=32260 RepID=UPI001C9C6E28|nr:UDP-glycosyltransferase UGT5-like [Venturia canescens]